MSDWDFINDEMGGWDDDGLPNFLKYENFQTRKNNQKNSEKEDNLFVEREINKKLLLKIREIREAKSESGEVKSGEILDIFYKLKGSWRGEAKQELLKLIDMVVKSHWQEKAKRLTLTDEELNNMILNMAKWFSYETKSLGVECVFHYDFTDWVKPFLKSRPIKDWWNKKYY